MVILLVTRLRGVAFLLSGIAVAGLLVYSLVRPGTVITHHPLGLVVLLVFTGIVAFWQASVLLR